MKSWLWLLIGLASVLGGYAAWAQTRAPTSLPGCQYNSTLPTLANRQTSVLQCDVNGKLLLG